jgi:transcription elongation factor Elf1
MPYKDREKRLEYAREWNRKNYLNNKQAEKNRNYARRKIIINWYNTYKKTLACVVCGEKESVCLDFHHLNPIEKDLNLATVKNWGYSIERLQSEINKCVILCSNCHRKLHAQIINLP